MATTTITPDAAAGHHSAVQWKPPTATLNLDSGEQLVDLNIDPAAVDMIRMMARSIGESPWLRATWTEAMNTTGGSKENAVAVTRLVHHLSAAGIFTITLSPSDALELAEDLDAASVERSVCRRCGRIFDAVLDDLCGPCEDPS